MLCASPSRWRPLSTHSITEGHQTVWSNHCSGYWLTRDCNTEYLFISCKYAVRLASVCLPNTGSVCRGHNARSQQQLNMQTEASAGSAAWWPPHCLHRGHFWNGDLHAHPREGRSANEELSHANSHKSPTQATLLLAPEDSIHCCLHSGLWLARL